MKKPKAPSLKDYGVTNTDLKTYKKIKAELDAMPPETGRRLGFTVWFVWYLIFVIGLIVKNEDFTIDDLEKVMIVAGVLSVTIGLFPAIWTYNFLEFRVPSKRGKIWDQLSGNAWHSIESYLKDNEEYEIELENYKEVQADISRERRLKKRQEEQSYWKKQSGHEFEVNVAKLYEDLGFDVELTPHTADGGIDLILRKDNSKVAVQCKRHKTRVAAGHMREFIGAMKVLKYKTGLFVTVGGVTEPAQKLADENKVEVIEAADLVKMRKRAS